MGFPVYAIDYKDSIKFEVKAIEPSNPFIKNPHPHRHDFYELVIINKGSGKHHIDFKTYDVDNNTTYFLSPGMVHALELQGPIEGTYVTFNAEFVELFSEGEAIIDQFSFFHSYNKPPVLPFPVDGNVAKALSALSEEYSNNSDVGRKHVLRSHLLVLLFNLERVYQNAHPDTPASLKGEWPYKLKKLLDQNFSPERKVRDYAKILGVSPNHLNDVVKHKTGKSVGTWIRERTVLEAKRLLCQSNLSIAQVGAQLDMYDPSYFARFFKRYTGMTPKAFRSQLS